MEALKSQMFQSHSHHHHLAEKKHLAPLMNTVQRKSVILKLAQNYADIGASFMNKFMKEVQEERDTTRFEEGNQTKILFDRIQIVDISCLSMALISLTLTIIQYELEYQEREKTWSSILLYFIFGSSLLLCYLTVVRYIFKLHYLKKRFKLGLKESLFSSGLGYQMLVEVFFAMLIPYPWLQGIVLESHTLYEGQDFYYHYNEVLCLFSVLRVALVLRIVLLNSYWNSNRAQRLCEIGSVEPGALFTLKCMMKTHPFILIFISYLASIPFFGYMLRIAEIPVTRTNADFPQYTYANSMWNVFITISTVGYGDFFPQTFLGRMIVFFICIWGTVIISLMVVVLTNMFNMSTAESKMYLLLDRLWVKEQMKIEVAKIFTNLIRGKRVSRETGHIAVSYLHNVKLHLKSYRKYSRKYRELSNSNQGFEEMERYFEIVKDEVDSVQRDLGDVVKAVKELTIATGVDSRVSLKTLEENKRSTRDHSPSSKRDRSPKSKIAQSPSSKAAQSPSAKRDRVPDIKLFNFKNGYVSDASINIEKTEKDTDRPLIAYDDSPDFNEFKEKTTFVVRKAPS